jgi:hypothetical protein
LPAALALAITSTNTLELSSSDGLLTGSFIFFTKHTELLRALKVLPLDTQGTYVNVKFLISNVLE